MNKIIKKSIFILMPILALMSCKIRSSFDIQSNTTTSSINTSTKTINTTTSPITTSINTTTSPSTTTIDTTTTNEINMDLCNFDVIGNETKVGMNYINNNEVGRKSTFLSDYGSVLEYPRWNYTFPNYTSDELEALYEENKSLINSNETYDSIDADGKLYLSGIDINKKLFKHTASLSMYQNPNDDVIDIYDDVSRVSRTINVYSLRNKGNYLTGLYAQPGEVITIKIDSENLEKTGGIYCYIGNNKSHQFYSETDESVMRNGKRMPIVNQQFLINSEEGYIGSFLGGPIYIEPVYKNPFSVTIDGAIEYPIYIDGLTTKQEFERQMNDTKAPFFDFELYDNGIRFSGPRYMVSNLSYENFINTSKMWRKINDYSLEIPHGRSDGANIEMYFETNVIGGLAMAYIGSDFCRLPIDWMDDALNYEYFMKNGSWGVIHEFNHHHQKFGTNGTTNEVTNNIVNLMEYIDILSITEYRNYSNGSHDESLNSNIVIDYLNEYMGTETPLNTEKGYAILVENIGTCNLKKAIKLQEANLVYSSDQTVRNNSWYKALSNAVEMDFSYYMRDICNLSLDDDIVDEIKEKNYPLYIPIGSRLASGFKYQGLNNIVESRQAKPYLINSKLTIDLKNDINLISGFDYEIKNITSPTYGTITYDSLSDTYLFESNSNNVSRFEVTITITDGTILEDIVIVYEFRPINSFINVETYYFSDDTYESINEALDDNFTKAIYYNYSSSSKQTITGIKKGTICHISGSITSSYQGTYTLCYKGGRGSSIFYAGYDKSNLSEIGYILINQNSYQFDSNAHSNKEIILDPNKVLYYELYILATSDNAWLTIGLSSDNTVDDVITLDDSLFGSFDGRRINDYEIELDYSKRDYILDNEYINDSSNYQISSERFRPWDSSYTLDNIFDYDKTNYAHSERNMFVSSDNPMDLLIDFNGNESFNKIILECYNVAQNYKPRMVDIYISDDGINFTLINCNIEISNRLCIITFDNIYNAYYVKLLITNTDNGTYSYFALSGIKFMQVYDLSNYYEYSPSKILYYGNVDLVNYGTFGHSYRLNSKSKINIINDSNNSIVILKIKDNDSSIESFLNDIEFEYNLYKFGDYYYLEFEMLANNTITIYNNSGTIDIDSISFKEIS